MTMHRQQQAPSKLGHRSRPSHLQWSHGKTIQNRACFLLQQSFAAPTITKQHGNLHTRQYFKSVSHTGLAATKLHSHSQVLQRTTRRQAPLAPSVFKITVVKDVPRFDMPLLLGSVQTIQRAAAAISYQGQSYMITTASSVVYGSNIKVHVDEEVTYPAYIAHLAMEIDLAILRVHDSDTPKDSSAGRSTKTSVGLGRRKLRTTTFQQDGSQGSLNEQLHDDEDCQEFWDKVQPIELADNLPALQDIVQVVRPIETEGVNMAVTAQVTRVEAQLYPTANYRLLGVTLDCAAAGKQAVGSAVVNADGRCCGIVFQRSKALRKQRNKGRRTGQDTLHAVPAPLIANFLNSIQQNGEYTGLAQLGIRFKHCDAPALRRYLGMQPEHHGILVLDVNPTSCSAGVLLPGDVITHVAGYPVGDDGTVLHKYWGHVLITQVIAQMPIGSEIQVSVLRSGVQTELSIRLAAPHRMVPSHMAGVPPAYFVLGGLVLTPLTVPYLEQCFGQNGLWGRKAPPRLAAATSLQPESSDQQVVVIAVCEPTPSTEGYRPELVEHQRVVSFKTPSHTCYQRVQNLRHLVQHVIDYKQGFIGLELADGSVVVLNAAVAATDAQELVAEYEAKHIVSKCMLDLLPAKRTLGHRRIERE